MAQIEYLIFDVSGTLWNDMDQVIHANLNVLHRNGFRKAPCGSNLTPNWLGSNLKGSCVEMFRHVGMKKESEEDLAKLYKDELENTCHTHPAILYPGIRKLLLNLREKDVRMSVVSAHPQNRLEADLQRLGIIGAFDQVKGSCHDKVESIFNMVRDVVGVDGIFGAAYIGDTVSDMRAANAAGVMPIGVSYGYQTHEQVLEGNPCKVLPCVNTLGEYVRKLVK